MTRLHIHIARHAGRTTHRLLTLAVALLLLVTGAGATVAWRLGQGPWRSAWVARRIEAAVNGDGPTQVRIGMAEIAWTGFTGGVDRPVDLVLEDVSATDARGKRVLAAPRASVSLSLTHLLLGELRPRAITLDSPRAALVRQPGGGFVLGLAPLPSEGPESAPETGDAMMTELGRPSETDLTARRRSRLTQLRRLIVRDADVRVRDLELGSTWAVEHGEINLRRLATGGVEGGVRATFALGEAKASLALSLALAAGGHETTVSGRLGPVVPARFAVGRLAPARALDAPVTAAFEARLGPSLAFDRAQLGVQVGPGQALVEGQTIPLADARLALRATTDRVTILGAHADVIGHPGAQPTAIVLSGTASRDRSGATADLTVAVDQVAFADLPALWPPGPGAREWVTRNITDGTARDANAHVVLRAPPDLASVTVASAAGGLLGTGMTMSWLRPIPPIEAGRARLRIVDPDTLDIAIEAGRQHPIDKSTTERDALTLSGGHMRITGIEAPHQIGRLEAEMAGGVAETIALLRHPKLKLLSRHPINLRDPGGTAEIGLSLSLPLEHDVNVDDIPIRVRSTLHDLHLGSVALGRDLSAGQFNLDASNDGLTLRGPAALGGVPVTLDATMDFRSGPPEQVLERIGVTAGPDGPQLASLGLDPGDVLQGRTDLRAVVEERRDGKGSVVVAATLDAARIDLGRLDWRKPEGAPARLSARLVLDQDHLAGIDAVTADGPGLEIRGGARMAADATDIRLDRLMIGKTDARGTVRLGSGGGGAIAAVLAGRQIDLSGRFASDQKGTTERRAEVRRATDTRSTPGRAWSVRARFDRALMARQEILTGVEAEAESDGTRLRRLRFEARTGLGTGSGTGSGAPVSVSLTPDPGGRVLAARADDAGAVLRAADLLGTIEGGTLAIDGRYADDRPGRPLTGTATIDSFRLHDAPAVARALKGMTLYGLVDLAKGPGIGISKLVAPFTFSDQVLTLEGARAVSPSLGVTVAGRIDLKTNTARLDGTIVPAYLFNSLLGRIPVIGTLFSPEPGGGLFAANYDVSGPLGDPSVSVNPLSVLTPGYLRKVFGLF